MTAPSRPEAIRQGDIPGVQLRRRAVLAVAPAVLWEWLVVPDLLERWACRQAAVSLERGTTFDWIGNAELGEECVETCETVDAAPPWRWRLALTQPGWDAATRLQFDLSAADGGSGISVLQNGFEHLSLSLSLTVWEAYRRRWTQALEALDRAIAAAAGF